MSRKFINRSNILTMAFVFMATLAMNSIANAQELVKNGSLNENANGWEINHDENFGGWKQEGGNGYLHLNHDGKKNPTMTQTLTGLTKGHEYILSARYRPGGHVAKHGQPNAAFFHVKVGDELRKYKLLEKKTEWKSLFFKFKANSESEALTIEGEIDGTDNDVDIDDVSVKPLNTEKFQIKAYTIKGAPGNNETYFIVPGKSGAQAMTGDSSNKATPGDFVKVKVGEGVAFKLYNENPEGGLFLTVNDKNVVSFVESEDNNIPEGAVFNVRDPLFKNAGKGWNSFESAKYKGRFLRHFSFKLVANNSTAKEARNTSENYQRDATWTMEDAEANIELDGTRFYIQFPENGAFVSFKNSDRDASGNHSVFLAPDGDKNYTKLAVTAVKHEKYFGFRVDDFVPKAGAVRWLEVGDDHNVVVGYRTAKDGVPGRGHFLTGEASFGRYLEAMWVNAQGASKAQMYHPDHHYYLTGSGTGIQKLSSKDFKVDQPKDKSAGWKLVPIN